MYTKPPKPQMEAFLAVLWRGLPEAAREHIEVCHLSQILTQWKALGEFQWPSSSEMDTFVRAFMRRQRQLTHLRKRVYAPQRSQEWLDLRKNLLTASDLASALGKGKFSSRSALVKKKAAALRGDPDTFQKTFAMSWGTMFEPMIARYYSEMHHDIELYEFGLIPHPTLSCFGASPDGITEMGTMVEIKCPWKRKIQKGEVPEHYYLQIQGQLAVCELDTCDYIEVEMEDLATETAYYEATRPTATSGHGVILEIQTEANDTLYEYSPPKLTPVEAYDWAKKQTMTWIKEHPEATVQRIRPWCVRDYNLVSVPFDRTVWETLVPQIQTFWEDVQNAAATPVSPPLLSPSSFSASAPIPSASSFFSASSSSFPSASSSFSASSSLTAPASASSQPKPKSKRIKTYTYREDDEDTFIF